MWNERRNFTEPSTVHELFLLLCPDCTNLKLIWLKVSWSIHSMWADLILMSRFNSLMLMIILCLSDDDRVNAWNVKVFFFLSAQEFVAVFVLVIFCVTFLLLSVLINFHYETFWHGKKMSKNFRMLKKSFSKFFKLIVVEKFRIKKLKKLWKISWKLEFEFQF